MTKHHGVITYFDWSTLAIFDDEIELSICLTQRQVMILKAALIPVYWSRRWEHIPATSVAMDELDELVSTIDSQLDGNDCGVSDMDFRDNPNDRCEVQYSKDGGETWLTMFRKDVCLPASPATVEDIEDIYTSITTITSNRTTYAGDILNVAPDWAWDAAYTDKALCYIIEKFIKFVCEIAIKQIETNNVNRRDANDWLDDLSVLLAAIAMETIVLTLGTATLPVAVIGAITWAATQFVEAVWDYLETKSDEYYRDEQAKEDVRCWMYNKIRGGTPYFELWEHSLDSFEGSDAANAIAFTAGFFIGDVDVFIGYMMLMADINSVAELLPVCACPQPLIINQLAGEFKEDMFGTELVSPTSVSFANPGDVWSVAPGVWFGGIELYKQIDNPIGGMACNIVVTLPDNALVTEIKVGWGASRQAGDAGGDKNAAIWLGDPNTDGVYVGGHAWGVSFYYNQEAIDEISDPLGIISTPRSKMYIHNSMNREGGENEAYIFWVYVVCIPYTP